MTKFMLHPKRIERCRHRDLPTHEPDGTLARCPDGGEVVKSMMWREPGQAYGTWELAFWWDRRRFERAEADQ